MPSLRSKRIDDRYIGIKELVESHSLFEVGFSIYLKEEREGAESYTVYSFSVDLVRADSFSMTADSLAFLASHGLDLNVHFQVPFLNNFLLQAFIAMH